MTKEMCPSYRTDVLTHALLYYGHIMMKKKLGMLVLHDVNTLTLYHNSITVGRVLIA
jgi:hypothetical protein